MVSPLGQAWVALGFELSEKRITVVSAGPTADECMALLKVPSDGLLIGDIYADTFTRRIVNWLVGHGLDPAVAGKLMRTTIDGMKRRLERARSQFKVK